MATTPGEEVEEPEGEELERAEWVGDEVPFLVDVLPNVGGIPLPNLTDKYLSLRQICRSSASRLP